MADTLTGGCLCGAIRYTVSTQITELRACHCIHCQKGSGTGAAENAVIPSASFRLEQGTLKRYGSRAESGRTLYRHFCGDCGSPIYSQRENAPEAVVLRVGSLDNPGSCRITTHIWMRSARPWSCVDPASRQLAGQPDFPIK
ncbi:MAG TPA: GFA family protein [Burkholderiales bacterium]|nr:GFA family protein [Burkholderiales bacterium]